MSLDIVFVLASTLAPFRVTTVIDDARPVATPALARVLVVALALDLLPLLWSWSAVAAAVVAHVSAVAAELMFVHLLSF